MSQGNLVTHARTAGATSALNYTAGYNQFCNQAYTVSNIFHREYLYGPPQRDVTNFGQTVTLLIDKNHDFWDKQQLEFVTNPAVFTVPQTVERYIDGFGYRLIDKVEVTITNTQLNSVTIPYEWARIKDVLLYDFRYVLAKRDNYLFD